MKKDQVTSYWKKLEKENLDMCASPTLFRLLKINGAKFKSKNVLDVGFGEGQNLIEFQKRGANIFGIELRKSKIKRLKLRKYFLKAYLQKKMRNNPQNVQVVKLFQKRRKSYWRKIAS